MMRKETIDRLLKQKEADIKQFFSTTLDPRLQKTLETYLNSLKAKNSKK